MNYQKQLNDLLEIAVKKDASDLHISVGSAPVLRIVGELQEIDGEKTITSQDAEGLAYALMNEKQKINFLRKQSLDLAYNLNGKARFRVNIFFQSQKIGIALRIISSKIKTIEELNLTTVLHKLTEAKQGFVLVTGATSQGKSTTLASMVDEINHMRKEHIITIEHPIEYVFIEDQSLIDQREVEIDTPSFKQALKDALRQDPDVIMVGELRDLETIATAITAAETGHLVLGTLHTNSASQTIHRLIDVFSAHQQSQIRAQLASSLLGIVTQRLVPAINGGIVPVCEVLMANPAVSNLIRENKIHEIPTIIETSSRTGMISLNQALADLVHKKVLDKEVAVEYSLNPDDLRARIK